MADSGTDAALLLELADRLRRGEEVVLVTAVATDGRPPCEPGRRLLAGPRGPLAGTLGCSEFDTAALADAASVVPAVRADPAAPGGTSGPLRRRYRHPLGEVEVLVEAFGARPSLVVIAATPVAEHLLRWAPSVGYRTTLLETRSERISGEVRELAGAVVARPEDAGAGPHDAVHTDHDAPGVAEHLAWFLRQGGGFVGAIGSVRHVEVHLDALRALGLSEEEVAKLRTPLGLNIGGRSTAEIALSILAGLVAARNGRDGGWMDRDRWT